MATLDIRVDEKLVFSQRVDSHKIDVADDGGSVNVSMILAEKLPAAEDVETMDIDSIHRRLQEEPDPSDAEPSADKVEPAPGNDSGTSDGGTYTEDSDQKTRRPGAKNSK